MNIYNPRDYFHLQNSNNAAACGAMNSVESKSTTGKKTIRKQINAF